MDYAAALIAAEMTSKTEIGTTLQRRNRAGATYQTTTTREGRFAEARLMAAVLLTRLEVTRSRPTAYGTVEGQPPEDLEDIVFATNAHGYEFRALQEPDDKDKFDKILIGKIDDPEAVAFAKAAIEEAVTKGPITRDYDFWRGVRQEDSQGPYNRVARPSDFNPRSETEFIRRRNR